MDLQKLSWPQISDHLRINATDPNSEIGMHESVQANIDAFMTVVALLLLKLHVVRVFISVYPRRQQAA
jgi:hypothetical protein